MKITKSYRTIIAIAAVAVLAIYLFIGAGTENAPRATNQGSFNPISEVGLTTDNTNATSSLDGTQRAIAVGGGNLTVSINQFSPANIEIQPGENVTFYAPSGSTEFHNVVLYLSNGSAISGIELGFILPPGISPEDFQLAPPDNFGEPIIQNMTDGRQSIVALNKVLFYPSAVDQNGHASYLQEQELIRLMTQGAQQGSLLPPPLSANYTMQGSEVVVSSGLILDAMGFAALEQGTQQQGAEGQQQQQQQEPAPQSAEALPTPAYPILSNFTVTFTEPGAYPFFCAFHPGMAGTVNVVDVNARQNSPGT